MANAAAAVIGPLEVSLGVYELEEPWGRVVELGRALETVSVPFAGPGAAPPAQATFRTYLLSDRTLRSSTFFCNTTAEAVELARFLDAHVAEARRWLGERLETARLREAQTEVDGTACRVRWAFTTGDTAGLEETAGACSELERYVSGHGPVQPERATLDPDLRGGKLVLAECSLDRVPWTGPAVAVTGIFAATGQELRLAAGSSAAERTERTLRLPSLQVGGPEGGDIYRFAQLVAAAALAQELAAV
jgi:hypothetical protein